MVGYAKTNEMESDVKESANIVLEETIEGNSDLDSLIESYIGTTIEGAAGAVVKENEIIYEKGFGYANQEQKIFVDAKTTMFEYGSVSKLFVWVAAMQLAEQGKLDLNKDVREYLPETLQKKFQYNDAVTMVNLMNHTAGFDDYIIGLFNSSDDTTGLEEWLESTQVRQYLRPGEQGIGMSHGFFQYPANQLVLWHNGETQNQSSFFLLVSKEKLAVCIVCNTGGDEVLNAERKIAFSFVDEWETEVASDLPDSNLAAGNYRSYRRCHHGLTQLLYALSPFDKVIQANEDGTVTVADEVFEQIRPYFYYCKESGRSFTLQTDEDGTVTGLHQLVGFEKISGLESVLWYLRIGFLVVGLVAILVIGICKKGWYRRIAGVMFLLVASIVIVIIKALQLSYFSTILPWMIVNIVLSVGIGVMLVLLNKKDWKMKLLIYDGIVVGVLILFATLGIYSIAG